MKRLLLFTAILAVSCIYALADITCRGTVIDDEGEPIVGAVVTPQGMPNRGVPTDIDGNFTINVPDNVKRLHIDFVGMKPVDVNVAPELGTIRMEIAANMLQDVVVTQSIARTRKTPVAVSAIDAQTIDVKLGNQELPEVLKTTPGVWATKDGGGFGDAKINIRGFKSQNTATMVNGVPVNDMEWGGIYWSNWSGLGDVISSMQVQRGLGAQIISQPSFGGTINMITKGLDSKKGGTVWYGLGNDATMNYGISVSTGMMKNGWAVTFLGSRKTGDGYIQGTSYEQFNYFLNISKRLNDKNQISLTVTGAPQTHYKRSSGSNGLSIQGWQDVANFMPPGEMYRYNPTVGYDLQGRYRNSQLNKYNKPVFMLNHVWQIDHKSSLSTVVYASLGYGGGSSGQGAQLNGSNLYSAWYGTTNGQLNYTTVEYEGVTYTLRHQNGLFAYDQIQLMNQASKMGSLMVMSESVNNHRWFGGVSNYKNDINEHLSVTAGIDIRYYYGEHTNKISDLYDGEYFIDYYRSASNNLRTFATEQEKQAYQQAHLGVGDIVYRNWDSRIWQEGVYGQAEYNMLDNNLNFVLSGAVNLNTYTRYENMYANEEDRKSPTKSFFAGSIKGGVNYNIDRHNNIFFNGGYITRAPYLQYGVFLSPANSNAINPNPKNEKVGAAEIGYEFHSPTFTVQLNGYYTMWMDKTTISSSTYTSNGVSNRATVNMNGVDSRYMGLEMNFVYKPTKWFELSGMLAYADNTWQNEPIGYWYNEQGQALGYGYYQGSSYKQWYVTEPMSADHAYSMINQKGHKIGGTAMMTGALGVQFRPFTGFRIGADWTMNARNYSDYNFTTNNSASLDAYGTLNIADPWRIPWGQQLDINASYNFPIMGDVRATISGNIYNVFNNYYIMDAYTDNSINGTWENATGVFYSYGRTFNVRLKVYF